MIAEWMIYCALCALGLFAGAALVERWLLNAGTQVRHVWTAALLLSIAIPAATYWFAPRQKITVPATVSAAATGADVDPLLLTQPPTGAGTTTNIVAPRDQSLRKWIPSNGTLLGLWITFSGVLGAYFVVGLVAIARMRRKWRASDVCGVQVLVSESTGPAVVNVLSPEIVMPEWALAMDRYQLGLMIRHEQEHRRVGDPQLLALAQVALIAMPWNPALWWGVTRLGLAIELDCDARVLRTADARTYGDLLLEVARPRPHPRLVASAAFAERADGLERRIRAIARRRERVTRGARAGAAILGLAVVGIAWVAPHPSLPPQLTFASPGRSVARGDSAQRSLENRQLPAIGDVRSETLATRPAVRVFRGDTIILPTMKARGDDVFVKTPRLSFSQLDSLIYDRLFTGILISADQEIAARLLLRTLAEIQAEQDQAMVVSSVQSTVARVRLNGERDSVLLALVPNDADRDVLKSRLTSAQLGGGRRGRSGNPPGITEIPVGQVGGPRSGSRGRVGGGDPSLQSVPVTSVFDDAMFGILFTGMNLTTEQEATAKTALATYRQKVAATIPEPRPFQLRLQGTARVVMSPENRTAVLAILSSDADRAVVDSRIVTEIRVINRPSPAPPGR